MQLLAFYFILRGWYWSIHLTPHYSNSLLSSLLSGDVCSFEPLEAGSPAGPVSDVSLCHLPALLHPLWADVRPSCQRSTPWDNMPSTYFSTGHLLSQSQKPNLSASTWEFLNTNLGVIMDTKNDTGTHRSLWFIIASFQDQTGCLMKMSWLINACSDKQKQEVTSTLN